VAALATVTTRPDSDQLPEWVTVGQAPAGLGVSASWFRGLAKAEGIEIRRRGRQPGVDWVYG
jgi:hypothetical protein